MAFNTLYEIADAANMTVSELLAFADREPQLKRELAGIPLGEPDSGIPPKPQELSIVLKRELESFNIDDEPQ
ncbi:MAG: hypothetical protein LBP59_11270 [Planctomycetaceae bacterium]|jgi:hypothetical protein|nr:hypothetical protein [Planctomycetaceae bacterium]